MATLATRRVALAGERERRGRCTYTARLTYANARRTSTLTSARANCAGPSFASWIAGIESDRSFMNNIKQSSHFKANEKFKYQILGPRLHLCYFSINYKF